MAHWKHNTNRNYGTNMDNVFYCEHEPTDPDSRATGWYYINRQSVPVGPFSSNSAANYASHRNEPAPGNVGRINQNWQ